jgi:hypothetical protein
VTEGPGGRWVSDTVWEFDPPLVFWPDDGDEPLVMQRLDMSILSQGGDDPAAGDGAVG